MAIVLPQGRFNNSTDEEIRKFIAARARIIAVVGLHPNTFKPHTGTKTSILFLQKWNDNPKTGELCPKLEDYPIFFAVSEKGGKDNSGKYIYVKDELGKPKIDGNGHLIIDNDLYNHALNDSNDSKELPDGVAEKFINNLERTFRIDADFYKPDVIEFLSLLSKKNAQSLTNYVKVSDGNHSKITEYLQDYPGVPYYRGKDINTDFFIENARPAYISESKYNQKQMIRSHFLSGDVLLSIKGTIGNLSFITDILKKSTGSRSIAALRPISEISSEYIAAFLRSKYGQVQLKRITRGTIQMEIILEDFDQIQLYPLGAAYVGKANLYNTPIRAICGSSLTLMRPIENLINPYYLLVFLNSSIGKLLTRRSLRGSVQQCIYPFDTKKVPIPLLEKSIQEQIEIAIREGEESFNKSLELLKIAKKAVEIAIEVNEEAANDFRRNNWPATLYVEAPYQQVLSHGFVVDEKGHKMSKSLGNVIDPEDITEQFEGLLKIISPILPFLAEEVYQNVPFYFGFAGQESIQLANYSLNLPVSSDTKEKSELISDFFLPLRQEIYQALEK
ncbi:1358_t:CDS:2, partial [Ambispora gerdemannii]